MALYAADDRLPVLQRSFHPPRLRACQPTPPTIPTSIGDVAGRFADHLRHGCDANDDQRTHDDGLSHPRPRPRLSVRIPRK